MSELHLRDWRHANQFYTNFGHAFSPKTKFLYHVVFEYNDKVPSNLKQNAEKFQKELSILVNSTDLPGFRVNMENKQQYNRKKNFQTRIDYQDVQMRLWDDNVGSVRSMLREYYQYYIEDGRHTNNDGSYKQRDKYHSGSPPNYGLNTQAHRQNEAFYNYIHIYQMGLQQWNRYTLVNPMLAQWMHGDVSYSEGATMVEHTLTFGYESVLYAEGKVGSDSEPKGFGTADTGYDTFKHEIYSPSGAASKPTTLSPAPSISTGTSRETISNNSPTTSGLFDPQPNTPNAALPGTEIPNTSSGESSNSTPAENAPLLSSAAIEAGLTNNPKATTAFLAQAINSGTIIVDAEGVNSYLDYKQLPAAQRRAIRDDAINQASSGDQKLAQFASNAIAANPK